VAKGLRIGDQLGKGGPLLGGRAKKVQERRARGYLPKKIPLKESPGGEKNHLPQRIPTGGSGKGSYHS